MGQLRNNKTLEQVIFILFAVGIVVSVTDATAAGTAPTVIYTCNENGTIFINTTNLASEQYTAFATDQNSLAAKLTTAPTTPTTTPTTPTTTGGTALAPTLFCYNQWTNLTIAVNSIITLNSCSYATEVYFYLMKEQTKNIIGGKSFHEYSLTCKLSKNGTVQVASAEFQNDKKATVTPTPLTHDPTIQLEMLIQPSSATVGEEMILTINETGRYNYILPVSCTADDGQSNSNNVTLLSKGQSADLEMLGEFTVSTKGTATASLYAFKFYTSNTVNLTCVVRICPEMDCNGNFNYYTTPTTSASTTSAPTTSAKKRRRRSIDVHNEHIASVRTTFRVTERDEVDKTDNNALGHGEKVTFNLVSTFLTCLLVTSYLKFQ